MQFSIVVPTHSRPTQLVELLNRLVELDFPRDAFEVIVVVDGGERPPPGLVAAIDQQMSLTILHQDNHGPSSARNRGAAMAKGAYLAFTDDDCRPADDWLRALTGAIERFPNCAIGGRVIPATNSIYTITNHAIWAAMYEYLNQSADGAAFFVSCNFAVPTAQFLAIGGFDTALRTAEDREFCDRWTQRGFRMAYAPEMLVRHAQHDTLRTFWERHFRYGRGAYHFHQRQAARTSTPVKIGPFGLYWKLFQYPFTQGWGLRVVFVDALVAVAQAAVAAGFLSERLRAK